MYILQKLRRLHKVVLMIRDYKHLIGLKHIRTEHQLSKKCKSEMMMVRDLFVEKYVDCPLYGEIVLKR